LASEDISVGPVLLTVPQVAQALQVNRNKVWALVGSGELPSVRIGRSVRVPVSALEEWVRTQTTVSGPEAAPEFLSARGETSSPHPKGRPDSGAASGSENGRSRAGKGGLPVSSM
jgi:excisionase family DNA binding protein